MSTNNNFLIKHTLHSIKNVNFTQEQLLEKMSNNTLDDIHVKIFQFQKQLTILAKIFHLGDDYWQNLITEAQNNIIHLKKQILEFYINFFQYNTIIGDVDNLENPTSIVVLGTNSPELLEKRIQVAYTLYKTYNPQHILVSGGGFNGFQCEAHHMQSRLLELGVSEDRIIQETDSMDTVGNALFSYLILKNCMPNTKHKKILIVTSDFHALRSYYIFKKVFVPEYFCLLVHAVPTDWSHDRLTALSDNELSSDFNSMETIFTYHDLFEDRRVEPGDTDSILLNLLTLHELYKNRSDLLRKHFTKDIKA